MDEDEFPPSSALWDCIDPCAFLCYYVLQGKIPFDWALQETLDNFGWCDENQQPDVFRMNREFERMRLAHERKRQSGNPGTEPE